MTRIADYSLIKLTEMIEFIDCEAKRINWPRKRLAHQSGVSNTTLARSFALKNQPTFRHIIAMLDALGYDLQIVPKKAGQE